MKYLIISFIASASFLCGSLQAQPDMIGTNIEKLNTLRLKLKDGDKALTRECSGLLKKADKLMKDPVESVMTGDTPPSGDNHDFFTIGKYAWPNPKTENGLPYKRIDCKINPESKGDKYDLGKLERMFSKINVFTRAWFYSGNEKYAQKASEILKVWFINADTKMNPGFNYASATPGVCDGMAVGIIFGAKFVEFIDDVKLLSTSNSWSKADDDALKAWFESYVKWLRESKFGKEEAKATNNHGSWYAAQIASASLYTGNTELVKEMAEMGKMLIGVQISEDGSFPKEMKRQWSFSYSIYNMRSLVALALCSEKVGVDLWNYKAENGRGILNAIEFLAPYLSKEKEWTNGVVRKGENPYRNAFPAMLQASERYKSPIIQKSVEQMKSENRNIISNSWF